MTNQNDAGDLVLSDTLQNLIHKWWLIAAFIIVGGLAGWLFSLFQRPVYESVSEITTSIDYAYSGRLTDVEQDHIITAVGDIIRSSGVIDAVKREIESGGYEVGEIDLEKALALSRQGYRWELSVRDADSAFAQFVNEAWLDASLQAMTELKRNSLDGVQAYLVQQSMETCFSQAVIIEPVSAFCTAQELDELSKKFVDVGTSDQKSLLKSLNLSGLSFQVTHTPDISAEPMRRQVNLMVLSGALIGLLASLLFFLLGLPKNRNLH